jgi:hypothetical protein
MDSALRPWLLELNLSPSLDTAASACLPALKMTVLRDTVRLAFTRPVAAAALPPPLDPATATVAAARAHWTASETARELANLGGFRPLHLHVPVHMDAD